MPLEPINENEQTIDLRLLPPGQRHALVFGAFDRLDHNGGMILVNDHDPQPLHYQLEKLFAGTLSWEYLEQGPDVWRVRIGKIASSGCCGSCGGDGH